jgi:hypothetical protein
MAARLADSVKQKRRAIRDARGVVEQALKADVNEAETRRRIERTFESVMGYDPFTHLSRERAVRGAGETGRLWRPRRDSNPLTRKRNRGNTLISPSYAIL